MWKCEVIDAADLDVAEVAELYRASGLAERRPVEDTPRFTAMVAGANLVVVARIDGRMVGIARCLTDGAYVTYLSDIAVDRAHQRRGIGVDLIERVRQAAPRAKIVLLSAPAATEYYPHIGFTRHGSAWVMDAAK
ncbi:GNAT family N-acetyltransferase [Streptomyces albireticuli]|uniref:GNAT family N-acetyltransferase n=1 Tax=Streptomyces albireticuli TaxID=1940 RepID=A0A2A2DER5_9ACTN|nr:GNAT family N-acetyltransferase [Streptomyces albireticuli]MCD9194731.1 GNAT family N-acetyltransferase [Streptomyces albireticuli]PAU49937.1 GNAT family N-acetyltransferase [Streptomyces albireticuli]